MLMCHTMEDVVQIRLNKGWQELLGHDKPDFIQHIIASIERLLKDNKQLYNISLDSPDNPTVTNPYNN